MGSFLPGWVTGTYLLARLPRTVLTFTVGAAVPRAATVGRLRENAGCQPGRPLLSQRIRWAARLGLGLGLGLGLLWPGGLWGWGRSAGARTSRGLVSWQVPGGPNARSLEFQASRAREGVVWEAPGRLMRTVIYKWMSLVLPSSWPSISKLFLKRFLN